MKSQVTFIYTVYHTIQIFRAVFKKKKRSISADCCSSEVSDSVAM